MPDECKFLTLRGPMVRLESISKAFDGKPVLRGLTLEIEAGERFVLLGRSGCGKTTLLRILSGFETPDQGKIYIAGKEVGHLSVERRPVGFIFQNYALFPHMTVYDNIAVGPRIRKMAEPEISKRVKELLKVMHLGGLENAYPRRLSGGESQRVALARALINQPKILLLDEPLSALDASLRKTLREELVEMQKTLGITFLFVTHDQDEAMTLADRMGIMEEGVLLQVGAPDALYNHPATPYVARFLGEGNRLFGEVDRLNGNRIRVALRKGLHLDCLSEARPAHGKQVCCFIRPEKLTFQREGKPAGGNTLEGTVRSKTFQGTQTLYTVELVNGDEVFVPVHHGSGSDREEAFQAGDGVRVHFPAGDILIFD